MKNKELAIVATLNNGKMTLLDIDHASRKCSYRYLTESEMKDMQLDTGGKYLWFETDIRTTEEDGWMIIFVAIEATPIVLHRELLINKSPIIL